MLSAIRQLFTMQPAPIPERHPQRAYVVGPAEVEPSQTYFGIPNDTYQPPEYAAYPAISNGVYACVNVRARNLSGLPLKVYRVKRNGDRDEVTDGPLVALLQKVNPYWTMSRLLDMTEQSLCVWGECFWFMERKSRQPSELWWARADRVTVHPHPTEYISHFTYEGPSGQRIRFERDETIWFRYANVADQYSGLAPLAAARLAADTASAAMHSNRNIFANGSQIAGLVVPLNGATFSTEQAKELAGDMAQRFKGAENQHRIGVLRTAVDIKSVTLSPKDAEFLGALNWTLEDIARAFSIPIDKIGGKRTYQNVEESEKVFWHDCMLPEARFIAAELTEQLLPHFGIDLVAEFDLSDIDVLHEVEAARWTRQKEQIVAGYETINALRAEDGKEPLPWGDVWWADATKMPVSSNERPVIAQPLAPPADAESPPAEEDQRSRSHGRAMDYGSPEHVAAWNRYLAQVTPYEMQWGRMTADLFNAQKQSILSHLYRLDGRGKREADPLALPDEPLSDAVTLKLAQLAEEPFDLARWTKTFRVEARELTGSIVEEAGRLAAHEVGLATGFNVKDPAIIRGIESQVQQFAESVNETTWRKLKDELQAGIEAGESTDTLAARVDEVMGDRIRSSAEVIARTEVTRATSYGTTEGWRQSGVVKKKRWLAALDSRTRPSHAEAHGQTVGLDDDFTVGGCTGPSPGNLDCVREVANCRCALTAVVDGEPEEMHQPPPFEPGEPIASPSPKPKKQTDTTPVEIIPANPTPGAELPKP